MSDTSLAESSVELLTRSEAAEFLGCKKQTLALWATVGRYDLPYVKIGRSVRYRRCDLVAFIERRTVTHTGEVVE